MVNILLSTQKFHMENFYRIPLQLKIRREVLRWTFKYIFRILYQVHIIGTENIPETGGYVIAYNHVSIVDPPFIITFWPIAPEALGAVDLWNRLGISIIIRLYRTMPVRRGMVDRKLLESTIRILQTGHPVMIAPEGTRSHTPGMQRANPGIAYLVDHSEVPVLPVGIVGGTYELFTKALTGDRPVLEMRIGSPFRLPSINGLGLSRREGRQQNADMVMKHISALLPIEYQGLYADCKFPLAR